MLTNLNEKHLVVTGGAGFMGSAFIRFVLGMPDFTGMITNIDCLTYAGNLENLAQVADDSRYSFAKQDIADLKGLRAIHQARPIDVIVHFAAESHVDRSIDTPNEFVMTNVLGTCQLLNFVRENPGVHFHHISTDEVYGALGLNGMFTESSPYLPNSPYAASKAASDHFVRAYHHTYNLMTTISHASNNFGPCQYGEKFIPLMIRNALDGKPLPVYGIGDNVREWLYVEDHASAIWEILKSGKLGEVYNIAGGHEMRNIDLLHLLLDILAKKMDRDPEEYRQLITFVTDRPGHDFRYALDSSKLETEIGWKPQIDFETAIERTVDWYAGALAL